jgi:hypothetical protein
MILADNPPTSWGGFFIAWNFSANSSAYIYALLLWGACPAASPLKLPGFSLNFARACGFFPSIHLNCLDSRVILTLTGIDSLISVIESLSRWADDSRADLLIYLSAHF